METVRPEQPRRIAIIHEWFTSMRGGEKCVEALCEVFPDATLFVLLHNKGSVSPIIERMPIHTSWIQHLPFAADRYRHYLPLFPAAVRSFRLDAFDLVISSNHCVAKGVTTHPRTLHICYCYTPMRYIWNQYDEYFGPDRAGLITRIGMRLVVNRLRAWDVRTAAHPHHFIAISENVRQRIRTIYGRESDVIYPPVETAALPVSTRDEGFALVVSALVPYKRIDLAVEAFKQPGRRLVVIGDGPDLSRLRSMAGPTVEFLGWQPDAVVRDHFARCRYVIFPGEEDFGIVPVEAMACGKPVIAYARGGALETVLDTPTLRTGVLFDEQSPAALAAAVEKADRLHFDPQVLHAFALRFDRSLYKRRMEEYILQRWREFRGDSPQP
jgi:glycosyltransferase involved in cell wall biosynthesis